MSGRSLTRFEICSLGALGWIDSLAKNLKKPGLDGSIVGRGGWNRSSFKSAGDSASANGRERIAVKPGRPVIALIEDEPLLRVPVAHGLDQASYNVISAASAAEGHLEVTPTA